MNLSAIRQSWRRTAPDPSSVHRGYRGHWLAEVLREEADLPPLRGTVRTDIAIIGGGYVGLWTALRIKEYEPSCEVAVIEADICGGGASGRNGGFVLSWWPKVATLAKFLGKDEAVRISTASQEAVNEIREFCETQGILAGFQQGGWLWTATTEAHVGAWDETVALCEQLGVDVFRRLSPKEVAWRTGSEVHLAGVLDVSGAVLQPAALVQGLARAALARGVRVFEHSPVVQMRHTTPALLRAPNGTVIASKVVIATNAWASALRELRRALVVVSSDVIATEAVPHRLTELGWTGGEGITDSQAMINYYRTTEDGRIVFGKAARGIAFDGRIRGGFDRSQRRARIVEADFRRTYPMLRDVRVDGDWSGPIDLTRDGIPYFGHLGGRRHIVYGVGWSGNGVAPSVLGGKILASLALELDNEWTATNLVDRPLDGFPPEPIRYVGAQVVRRAMERQARMEFEGRSPDRLTAKIASLAPAAGEQPGAVPDLDL